MCWIGIVQYKYVGACLCFAEVITDGVSIATSAGRMV